MFQWESSILDKMLKLVCTMCLLAMAFACQQTEWRGIKVLCCANGTIVGEFHVARRATVCPPELRQGGNDVNDVLLVLLLVAIVLCTLRCVFAVLLVCAPKKQ